jgi:hypothetical protein
MSKAAESVGHKIQDRWSKIALAELAGNWLKLADALAEPERRQFVVHKGRARTGSESKRPSIFTSGTINQRHTGTVAKLHRGLLLYGR